MGTTNLDTLALGETLTVTGASTLTGATTITGALSANGGLTVDTVAASGIVDATAATLAVTAALHAGKIVTLNRAAGVTVTLPAATATGNVYTFVIGTAATSNANIIETSATSEHMAGSLRAVDDDVEGATGFQWNAETSDDTITMNGTATGGKAGDMIIIRDYVATIFTVDGHLTQSGGSEVTPFSAAVS